MSGPDPCALPCSACGRRSDLAAWLDGAGLVRADRPWLVAPCPACGERAHLELRDGAAAIGSLSPHGPALFRPDLRLSEPSLRVRTHFDGIEVALPNRCWTLAARR